MPNDSEPSAEHAPPDRRAGRFVILQHDFPFLHWDFLLECGASAHTWRLLLSPQPNQQIPAERLPDHRLRYLNYEGPVSGNRGSVQRLFSGTYVVDRDASDVLTIRMFDCELARQASWRRSLDGSEFWEFEA